MLGLENFLPPYWTIDDSEANVYLNKITGEKTDEHPFNRYLNIRNSLVSDGQPETSLSSEQPILNSKIKAEKKEDFFDYHCQWTERDSNGKISVYGLVIRYTSDEKIMVKFDGIEAEWVYSSLQGPSGSIEQRDLYVGAKVTVFGRHLTVSSANYSAIQWIDKEAAKLEKTLEEYRNKILSMGVTPCIKKNPPQNIRNISRTSKAQGQRDIKLLRKEVAKLGEQLANLGLTHLLVK